MLLEALRELANPERVRDRISIDERDGVPLRLPNPEVPPGPPGSPEEVQMDEVVPLLVPPPDVSGRVLAVRIDDDHLDRRFLDDEAVQEAAMFLASLRTVVTTLTSNAARIGPAVMMV